VARLDRLTARRGAPRSPEQLAVARLDRL